MTYLPAYKISKIGTVVFDIPYCVLQFQQKKKPLIENLFHIALGPAILFKWIWEKNTTDDYIWYAPFVTDSEKKNTAKHEGSISYFKIFSI